MPHAQDRDAALQRLAALVTQCRAAKGWSKEKAAAQAGIAHMTYRRIEEAKRVQAATYAKLEQGFDMTPGSCLGILDGARSIQLRDGTEMTEGARITRLPDSSLEDEARQSVTQAAIATTPDLTAREIHALSDKVVEELRRRGILPPNTD